ncbi:MAG: sulfatase [Ferruginibacter sp.]|nr:sulfatase [Ferruginibacter sp.]
MKKIAGIAIAIFFGAIFTNVGGQPKEPARSNVLFIFVDDLRPELGCYGSSYIHSPNLDKLASQAVVFKKQFVTVPTCGASRASLLTGMLPRMVGELSNEALESKKAAGNEKAIPESFVQGLRQNGYYTVGIGKISHSPDGYLYKYLQPKGKDLELPASWDEMLFDPGKWGTGWNAFFGYANGTNRNELKGAVPPYEGMAADDESYPDGLTAKLAEKKLQELSGKKQPFFLGVGFFKPHLPFNAPKKYWDLYDESKITLTPSPGIPQHVNPASFHQSAEFNDYKLGDEKASLSAPVSDDYARKLRHAYYASVSYVDAQVGKVLAELKRLNMDKNTIVIVWGDHGWHLGDDRVWGKHTLSEWALRSPLMIKMPGSPQGASCDKIVSSIDVYPTLMELCGVKTPFATDGKSLVPLLKDPKHAGWSNVAYSYFRRGISVRTDDYRFTRYFRKQEPVNELYDHRSDPFENNNISGADPIIETIMPFWKKGNTGLYDKPQNIQQKSSEE